MTAPVEYRSLLQALNDHAVDYIVVGGLGAILRGVPISTLDFAVVYSVESGNLQRLVVAVGELNAVYRTDPERRLD